MPKYFSLLTASYDESGTFSGWPNDILERFAAKEFWAEGRPHRHGVLVLELNVSHEGEVLRDMERRKIKVRRTVVGKWNAKHIEAVPIYQVSLKMGATVIDNFSWPEKAEKRPLFDRESQCGYGGGGYAEGCALIGKRQLVKLPVRSTTKIPKSDVFRPSFKQVISQEKIFVVTRRVRDLIVENGLTGCELRPVLDLKLDWSSEDWAYEKVSAAQEDAAEWFELTVVATTAEPLRMTDPLPDGFPACEVCGQAILIDIPYCYTLGNFSKSNFSQVDFQVGMHFYSASGQVYSNAISTRLFLSAKCVRLFHEHRVTGFVGQGYPIGSCYRPVYMEG